MEDLTARFETVKKVKSWLASEHAKIQTHVLNLLNSSLAERSDSARTPTPPSLLRAIKLWYILPGLLHSFDGRVTRKEHYQALRRGDISSILPWLMEYTKAARTRNRGPTQEETQEDKFKRAAQACRHSGGVKDAARTLLAEQRSPGNDDTWERLKAKFPQEDPAAVEQAIADAIAEARAGEEDGSVLRWRPECEFDSKVLFDVISSRAPTLEQGTTGRGSPT